MYQEKDVPERFPSSATFGLTQRMAAVSSRRPRRTLAIWGLVVVVALVLAGTSLKGLTTTAHVVGTTQSSQAEALYNEVVGSASQKPTDVIVVSSKSSTASDQDFKVFVGRLEAKVGASPGITNVVANFGLGSPLVSDNRHAALISLRAATDADIKPVVHAVQSANGSGGFSVAVTGDHTVDNDFSTLATSDLRHGELDFGLPIAIIVLLLVFGAVVAGLMPVLMALLSILVGLGIATLVGEEFHLSTFIVNMMTGDGPGARDRLFVVRHLPLPGGEGSRPRQGGSHPTDGCHRQPRRVVQRKHFRDRPLGHVLGADQHPAQFGRWGGDRRGRLRRRRAHPPSRDAATPRGSRGFPAVAHCREAPRERGIR